MDTEQRRSALDRLLNIFTDVREGESRTALLLALNVFLILMAYYILKPVREALILSEGSAELKSYMSAALVAVLSALLLIAAVMGYMDSRSGAPAPGAVQPTAAPSR